GQVGVNFLSWMVEALIANSAQNGLGIVRISDETGLDIEGSISLSADFGIGETKPLGLSLGASAGVNTHLGGSIKKTVNDEVFRRIYLGGGYDIDVGIGPKIPGEFEIGSKFLYPYRLMQTTIPSSLGVQFGGIAKWQNDQWQNLRLEASLESNSYLLNIYNLPGNTQQYAAWLEFDNEDVKNLFLNFTEHSSEVFNIGVAGVNTLFNDNSFKDDIVDFMDAVYQEQNDDQPVTLKYGFDAYDRNEYSIDMTVQFPLPVFPALDIVIGGGLESTKERSYKLAEGYWVKGLPYLQTEMPNPPQPQETFEGVMTELWGNVTSGNVLGELVDVIVAHLTNVVVKWWPFKGDTQITYLNPEGTTLEIRENSIPLSIDSLFCRHWEWGEEPATKSLDAEQKKKYKDYIKGLRDLRESATGLHYGIGGFFRFEPPWEEFGDSTLLTIVYPDTAVVGFDETELHMFWEDTLGIWHPLESNVMPDSNKVSAWITHFTTYTLAPKLPQGNYGLQTDPDSIPADGTSTALIYSDTLLYNDSTIIVNGMFFTVETTRGTITSTDMDLGTDGIQVELFNGTIQFEVQADSIPTPITLTAKSVEGFAICQTQLTLFDTVHPNIPTNLQVIADKKGIHLTWNGVNDPDLSGYKIYFDTDTIIPPYNGISTVWGEPSPINVGVTTEHLITGMLNDTTYFIAVTAIDIAGNESDYSVPVSCTPNFGRTIDLKIFLEGPFNGTQMNTTLNAKGQLPTSQPYNTYPWFYEGEEIVAGISNTDIIDWVLIELRETPYEADSAISTTMIDKRAAFLLKDGSIVGIDGNEAPSLYFSVTHNLYVVIWHRNHLGVMSSDKIPLADGDYSFDFTTGSGQVYGGEQGYKQLATNVWGMIASDGNADGEVNIDDKDNVWAPQAGEAGYKSGDYNMDTEVDNKDKDDYWVPNEGSGTQVPD
ncbi:MAG: fibronectin type III domain-containing protein, partial [Bacteroidales bacterium]|nr:fibronectin type III domain-containing protein [Bacteroidales bacterium]